PMRADTIGAKTWLLGAVAAWALCAWLLALLGMGGGVTILAEDPALLQPLPQAAKPPPERLGPLQQYSEIGRRPLFTSDRRPQPFIINPDDEGEVRNDFDYVLTSVMIAPDFRMAILQPREGGDPVRVRVGTAPEAAPGWQLVSIEPRSAVFEGPDGERKLELRVFDGKGGIPPTATSAQPDEAGTQVVPTPAMPRPSPPDTRPVVRNADDPAAGPMEPGQPPNPEEADNRESAEQIDSIRKRIEARRAKLRQDALESSSSGQTP